MNPASRRGARYAERARQAIEHAGASCDMWVTERPGHAREMVEARHAEYEVVFTLGGDGTAMEVIGALASSGLPIGVLPGGTGNLLAGALGIPLNIGRAVAALMHGEVRHLDLGSVLGHHFAVAAGVGIDAAMVAETPTWLKTSLGVLAYTLIATRAALRSILFRKFFLVRVDVDGEIIERRAASVMFANLGSILEGRITFGPGIVPDDGLLDCIIISPDNLWDAMRIMWRVTRRDFRPDRALLYRRGARFQLETNPVLALQADGELLGVTPVDIRVEPLAAHLLVPRRGSM